MPGRNVYLQAFPELSPRHNHVLFHALIYTLIAVAVGIPGVILAELYRRRQPTIPFTHKLAVVSTGFLICSVAVSQAQIQPFFSIIGQWVAGVFLTPLTALILFWWHIVFNFFRPRDIDEHIAEQKQKLERERERTEAQAQKLMTRLPQSKVGFINMGAVLEHVVKFPDDIEIIEEKGLLYLSDKLLNNHMMVIGANGAGKSVTLTQLISEVLKTTSRRVYVVDGKGDEDFAQEIANRIAEARNQPIPIVALGNNLEDSSSVYNGFRGTDRAIFNRIAAMIGVEEARGNATVYADRNRRLLQHICYAPEGAPKSFEELQERLDPTWLSTAYQQDPRLLQRINRIPAEHFSSLEDRIEPIARELESIVDPAGFAIEDVQGAVFSLRAQSVGDSARRFVDFFVEDIKDCVGNRLKEPSLLVIDEFGVLGNKSIDELLMLARSAGAGVILATQDVATLGDPRLKQIILSQCRTRIAMATDYPTEIAELSGTVETPHITLAIEPAEGGATGRGSIRPEDEFAIKPNDISRLKPGQAYIMRQRYASKVQIRFPEKIELKKDNIAHYEKPVYTYVETPSQAAPEMELPKKPKRARTKKTTRNTRKKR